MRLPPSSTPVQTASLSSSGFADGLGHRVVAFDREHGLIFERLVVRPELAAFEPLLRERLARLAPLADERIVKPRTIERDDDGSLVVVSDFVPGSRLSELLELAAPQGLAGGVDAALGFLLDVLPALCALHGATGGAHGTLAPGRLLMTPSGQVVLLDPIFGGALASCGYGARTLWRAFGIGVRPSPGRVRLDTDSDVTQAALASVMIVLGRSLADEYPDGLRAPLREVLEAAQIRGSAPFARGFEAFLERTLPLRGSVPFACAEDALIAVRDLAEELGVHVCRRALADYVLQLEGAEETSAAAEVPGMEALIGQLHDQEADEEPSLVPEDAGLEISLDALCEEDVYELDAVMDTEDLMVSGVTAECADEVAESGRALVEADRSTAGSPCGQLSRSRDQEEAPLAAEPPAERERLEDEPRPAASAPAANPQPDVVAAANGGARTAVRLRKGGRLRSSRARKDRLRSAAAPELPAPPAAREGVPAIPGPAGSAPQPLVPPDRAAAFDMMAGVAEAPGPAITAPPAVPAPSAPPVPVLPVFAPAPFASPAPPPPVAPFPPAVPASLPPPLWTPPPVIAAPLGETVGVRGPTAGVRGPTASGTLKLKEPPASRHGSRVPPVPDIYAAPAAASEPPERRTAFPWKLAAAAVLLMAAAVSGGHLYLPAQSSAAERTVEAAPSARPELPASGTAGEPAPAAATGRLEIETQPAGARILLDGKAVGHSPLALDDIPPGRRIVTIASTAGTVRRTVRIEAGQTMKIDVPVFSGWVDIFAPFVVEVSAGGRVIGTTEEPRLMLSPGSHQLTLTSRALGYHSVHTVDVEPGEVRTITIDPRGQANFNASPWAEVWIDGRKAGDTPIAHHELPLGTREVIFAHPDLGERRRTITVRADAPAILSVDMRQP